MMRKIYGRLSVAVGLPWFVAFSGGKDSTAVLDIAYRFSRDSRVELAVLHNEELLKPPPVFAWVYWAKVDGAVLVWSRRRGAFIHLQARDGKRYATEDLMEVNLRQVLEMHKDLCAGIPYGKRGGAGGFQQLT